MRILIIIIKLDRHYVCGFHHCGHESSLEGKLWGIYIDTSSNCSSCQKKCDLDDNCTGVECEYFDDRYCVWWKDLSCGPVEERTYSMGYKTCVKPVRNNDSQGTYY